MFDRTRYKIYVESFRGAGHLRRILAEAQAIVGAAPAAPTYAVSKRIESWGIPESGLFMIHDARRAKEAAEMALSDDLRKRVVEAVTDGGMSRNAAAKRFGVSIASAVRWLHRFAARRDFAGSHGRGSPLGPHRGASRLSVGSDPPAAGHDAVGNPGAPDRQLRRAFLFIRDLALLRSPRDHF